MMELDIISYQDLINPKKTIAHENLESALLHKGVVGIRGVPEFEAKTRAYINAVRQFCALNEVIKKKYAPNRDVGDTMGYEIGAEWFQDSAGEWKIDDKKASYYAFVPDRTGNKWPHEIDIKTHYLTLGELIFTIGKMVLDIVGINANNGIMHDQFIGSGRMLHYHKDNLNCEKDTSWCGAHFDHGVFTGLIPAYYFQDGQEVDEPSESGLYIAPSNSNEFVKIDAADKSVLLFQAGEFGQLILNDRIRATQHLVKRAKYGIERFSFALFYSLTNDVVIKSNSVLTSDSRYANNQCKKGFVTYGDWHAASFERYRAK